MTAPMHMVDAGFSCRQIERRLESLGEELARIDTLLLTHEHQDHCRGADVKFQVSAQQLLGYLLSPSINRVDGRDMEYVLGRPDQTGHWSVC